MESTVPTSLPSLLPGNPASVAVAFATISDPRRACSVIYPLPAVLSLAVAALLCAHTSVLAMAEWGARQPAELLQALGFPADRTPHQSTLHRLFRRLDPQALSRALQVVFDQTGERTRGEQGVAIDGKAQRGRLPFQTGGPVVHALTAFCPEQGTVLSEAPIEQGSEKAQAELTVAPTVLATLDWHGRVLTGDAEYCQRALCQQVLEAGGDYLLVVKGNQPALYRAVKALFHAGDTIPADRRAQTVNRGHGRTAELRQLVVADHPPQVFPAWPGVAQAFRLERQWSEQGQRKRQVRYGITSLPPAVASPARLLALRRRHWLIENRLNRAKDVALHEDASLIHVGNGPSVCSLLRDLALSLLHRAGCHQITARLRLHSQCPHHAVALLLQPPPRA